MEARSWTGVNVGSQKQGPGRNLNISLVVLKPGVFVCLDAWTLGLMTQGWQLARRLSEQKAWSEVSITGQGGPELTLDMQEHHILRASRYTHGRLSFVEGLHPWAPWGLCG